MPSIDPTWQYIYSWIHETTPTAPVLVTGLTDTSWNAFFEHARAAAMCNTSQDVPCMSCPACKQAQTNTHADIVTLEGDEKIIRVKHVRDIQETLHRTPLGKRRLIVIPRAERLHIEAANMLLKELEESTISNRFLLTTSYRNRVLPTIRSRCQILRLPKEYIHDLIQRLSKTEATSLLRNLSTTNKREALQEEELTNISHALQTYIREGVMTPNTYRALLRLRDYYKIRALRGNEKLAADVLLASLAQLGNTNDKHS